MKDLLEDKSQEIKDTDIVFECPHCGKSLAIDYRAAGLSIPCTDCGKLVVVPIPDGMEISDLDTTAEDQAAIVIHLREALLDCQTRMRLLEAMVEDSKAWRKKNEQKESDNTKRFEQMAREIEIVRKSVDQINTALKSMTEIMS